MGISKTKKDYIVFRWQRHTSFLDCHSQSTAENETILALLNCLTVDLRAWFRGPFKRVRKISVDVKYTSLIWIDFLDKWSIYNTHLTWLETFFKTIAAKALLFWIRLPHTVHCRTYYQYLTDYCASINDAGISIPSLLMQSMWLPHQWCGQWHPSITDAAFASATPGNR